MNNSVTNRFFIRVDKNDYVIAMLVAVTPEEVDEYENLPSIIELSQEIFESIGPDSKYRDGEVIQGEPRTIALTEETVAAIKRSLLLEATNRIQILQDSIELGIQEAGDDIKLQEWKKYRVLLDRLDATTAPNNQWPAAPAG